MGKVTFVYTNYRGQVRLVSVELCPNVEVARRGLENALQTEVAIL